MGAPRLLKNKSGLWTGLMLFTLTWSVPAYSQEEVPADVPSNIFSSEVEEAAYRNYVRELYEQQAVKQFLARRLGLPELPSEPMAMAIPERIPLPLAYQAYHGALDESSKEVKRGPSSSYMSLCHFKICQIGKKRSNVRSYSRLQ